MPGRNHNIPSYRLHKPTGLAVVRLNGRDIYLGKHGTPGSRADYERVIAEWLTNHCQIANSVNGICVDELLAAYLDFAEDYYIKNGKPTSTFQHIRDTVRPLHQMYGQEPVSSIGPVRLKTIRQHMIDEDRWCRNNINKAIGIIKRVFKWGVENELVSAEVYHGLQAVSGLRKNRSSAREIKRVKPVSEDLVFSVLPHVSAQVASMIEMQLCTGMRPCEVTIIRAIDLDMTGNVWLYKPGTHKTEHHDIERVIFLGPKAQKLIHPFLNRTVTTYLFSPVEAELVRNKEKSAKRKTSMTPSQRNRRRKKRENRLRDHYDTVTYRRAIHRACDKAFPIPSGSSEEARNAWRKEHQWSPNQLRHNAATRIRKEYGLDAEV